MAKKRTCRKQGCDHPAAYGKQTCGWHWLLKQPIGVQEEAADRRLARSTEERTRVPAKEWPDGCRYCSGCRSMVPLFYTSGSRCKACASRANHRSYAEREYLWPEGVTYESLYELQQGRCAICGRRPKTRRLAIDHDHKTGWVRGLLCGGVEFTCNSSLLPSAQDDVRILRRAVYYLERTPSGHGRQA